MKFKVPPGIPSRPDQVYKGKGWKGWDDFLGIEKPAMTASEVSRRFWAWVFSLGRKPTRAEFGTKLNDLCASIEAFMTPCQFEKWTTERLGPAMDKGREKFK